MYYHIFPTLPIISTVHEVGFFLQCAYVDESFLSTIFVQTRNGMSSRIILNNGANIYVLIYIFE
jgi:hypothetical protein